MLEENTPSLQKDEGQPLLELDSFSPLDYRTFRHKNRVSSLRDRRKEERRICATPVSFPERRIKNRRLSERRTTERRIEEVRFDITHMLKKNSERLWDFYLKCNFLYPAKISFLTPVKDEVLNTMDKLTNCADNTCKFVFIMEKEEILGSVMAVQYTDDTWMVQHIVTSPRHVILTKELILQILIWMMKNKKMRYFINYYQEKTRWASKTYRALVDHIRGPRIGIEDFDYMYARLSDLSITPTNRAIRISELKPGDSDYAHIYDKLTSTESEIMLNSIGIGKKSCFIGEAEANYKNLGLLRTRKCLVARHNNEIAGFAFADISSYGISLSLLFNVFFIYVFDVTNKESVYEAMLSYINSILAKNGKIYSIGISKPQDRKYLEKSGYQCSRNYSAFVVDRENDQFLKSYNIINAGRK